jgi:hypothetical protein
MDDASTPSLEARIWALETLVAFLFAAQHMQTPDPAAAVARLRALLLGRTDIPGAPADAAGRDAALAQLERSVARITALQESLPRRLVD